LRAPNRVSVASRSISPFAPSGRMQHRQRRSTPIYGAGLFILAVLALIGAIAVVLLVLGLLDVHAVTDHFRIH
jgi:hypothetical protein